MVAPGGKVGISLSWNRGVRSPPLSLPFCTRVKYYTISRFSCILCTVHQLILESIVDDELTARSPTGIIVAIICRKRRIVFHSAGDEIDKKNYGSPSLKRLPLDRIGQEIITAILRGERHLRGGSTRTDHNFAPGGRATCFTPATLPNFNLAFP